MQDTKILATVKCTECGHIQTTHGFRVNPQEGGGTYFGSGYSYCDECDGYPEEISRVETPATSN
jgi:hypothetical protein